MFSLEDLTWRTAAGDPDVTAVLRQRYLAPFAADADFGRIVLASVRSYLDHDRRISAAARALSVHENTLRYRLQKFEQATGARLDATGHYRRALLGLRGMPGGACRAAL